MNYFEEANKDMDPVLINKLDWTQVKEKISMEIKNLDLNKLAKI